MIRRSTRTIVYAVDIQCEASARKGRHCVHQVRQSQYPKRATRALEQNECKYQKRGFLPSASWLSFGRGHFSFNRRRASEGVGDREPNVVGKTPAGLADLVRSDLEAQPLEQDPHLSATTRVKIRPTLTPLAVEATRLDRHRSL